MYVCVAVVVAVVATRHGKHSDGEVVWHLYLTSCRARVDVDVAHLREGDTTVSRKATSIICESDTRWRKDGQSAQCTCVWPWWWQWWRLVTASTAMARGCGVCILHPAEHALMLMLLISVKVTSVKA